MVGVLVTALGVIGFYGEDEGLGVAGFVFGVGTGALGVLLFVTDFILRIFRRTASLMVRFKFWCIRLEVHGELGTPVDDLRVGEETFTVSQPEAWPE
jgi:hypothetical protein